MNGLVKPIEQALLPLFKPLPALPESARKTLVKAWPILALIFGVLQLWAAYGLWHLGHVASAWVDYANQLSLAAGNGYVTPGLGFFYYLGLAVLVVDAVILLMAVSPLNGHRKSGWDLLLLGATLNLAYGLVMLFDSYYGGFGNLLGTLLGSAIAYYVLFQVREYYIGTKAASATPKASPPPAGETKA